MTRTPSEDARAAHAELTRIWGGRPKVFDHGDAAEEYRVAVAFCEDMPVAGITSVATLGLSDHDLGMGPVRVELIGAFPASFAEGQNVAATCAFNAIKDGLPVRPDAIHPNVVALYRRGTTVPHVLLTDPFLWDDGPNTLAREGFSTAWLMMVPISESEQKYAEAHGVSALTALFEQHQIDIYNLERPSVA